MNMLGLGISVLWCFVSLCLISIQLAQSSSATNDISLEHGSQNKAYESLATNILNQLEDINKKLGDGSLQFPKDCCSVQLAGNRRSGLYSIYPFKSHPRLPIQAYCDLSTRSGGWTVFQRRGSGSPAVDFYRGWAPYVTGFGNVSQFGSFWLGLRAISALTESNEQSLRVDLTDWSDVSNYAEYEFFKVGNSDVKYNLSVSGYAGSAGDSLSDHNGMPFSTRDRDNDGAKDISCSQKFRGAWWYHNCYTSTLNGVHQAYGQRSVNYGIQWQTFRDYSLKTVEMKVRPRQFLGGCSRLQAE